MPADVHRGEDDGQGGRRHDVLDGQFRDPGAPVGALPFHGIVTLDPEDRLPRRVVRRAEGCRPEPARGEVVADSGEFAVHGVHGVGQVFTQGLGIQQAPDLYRAHGSPRKELPAPAEQVLPQRPEVRAEDPLDGQLAPQVGQLVRGLPEGAVMRGQVGRVDGPGAHSGDDGYLQLRKPARQVKRRTPAWYAERAPPPPMTKARSPELPFWARSAMMRSF